MNCSRCHGLMISEHFLDFEGTYGHMWASGHRCMNCGNVHDPVIDQHRRVKGQPALALVDNIDNEAAYDDEVMHSVVMRAA